MRLACPNCEAIYDVPDDAIPPEGRDVECSNCGHGWFEASAALKAGAGGESLSDPPQAIEDEASDDDAEAALMAALTMEDDEEPNPLAPPPRKIDQSVLDVLRSEAQRESEAREKERRERAKVRIIMPEPASPQFASEPVAAAGATADFGRPEDFALTAKSAEEGISRRDLLPDVEEINSSLLADHDSVQAGQSNAASAQSKSLGYGFVFGLILAAIAGGIYLKAEDMTAQWPALSPYVVAYSAWVDGLIAQAQGVLP